MSLLSNDAVGRVLMTTDTVGGVWNYSIELSRALGARGIQVGLATMGEKLTESQRKELRTCPHLDVFESGYALEWMADPWEDVARAAEWLWELGQNYQPDVVHLNSYVHASLPWAVPVLVVGHSCVLSWWHAVKGTPVSREWDTYTKAVKHGLDSADRIVAPSQWMARELALHYQLEQTPDVIYNGRSSQAYASSQIKEPRIISVGRIWDEAKNLELLTSVAAELPWAVTLVGPARGPDGGEVSFQGVEMTGLLPPEKVADQMSRAAIYVAPASYEPFGLSILEAALSGCALILGDIPSLRELWEGAALFVPPHDRSALRSAVYELINSPETLSALGRAARLRGNDYGIDRMTEAYLHLYRSMVGVEV